MARYFFRHTQAPVGVVMGLPTLRELFDEKYYTDLEGGLLEAFGRLFQNGLRLYVYPERNDGKISTVENFQPPGHLVHLYRYLRENGSIFGLEKYREEWLDVFSRDALAEIRAGDSKWESKVPDPVAAVIRERGLLGHRASA